MSNMQEKYMSEDPDFLDSMFFDGAGAVKKDVGKIRIDGDRISGTGFRISKNLIMTCQHMGSITPNDVIIFNYVEPAFPNTPADLIAKTSPEMFNLRPDILYYESSALDFVVVAISDPNGNLASPDNMREAISNSVRLIKEKKELEGLRLSIFSYPKGKPLKASLRKKAVIADASKKLVVGNGRRQVTEEIILHAADTEGGSSGAPIFDEHWRLVGIHQGFANELVQIQEGKPAEEVLYSNYGTFVKYILDELFSKQAEEPTEFETKFNDSGRDLGIPFKQYCNKLKHFPNPALRDTSILSQSQVQQGKNSKKVS